MEIANKWLRPAALKVFERQIRGIIVILVDNRQNGIAFKPNDATKRLQITGLKMWLQYIRCFSLLISNLQIHYYFTSRPLWCMYVHHHISSYFVDSLKEIEFFYANMTKVSFDQFVKPFTNVHSISLELCYLGQHLLQFAKWFPNLKHLKLENVRLTDGFDRVRFPHLEELFFRRCIEDQYKALPNASNLLDLNRQIRSLHVHLTELSMNTLLDMIQDHSSITKLTVSRKFGGTGVNSFEIERIANEHSSLVELDLKDCLLFTADDVIALIGQLESLKTLSFRIQDNSDVAQLELNLNQNEWTLEWTDSRFKKDSKYLKLNREN